MSIDIALKFYFLIVNLKVKAFET